MHPVARRRRVRQCPLVEFGLGDRTVSRRGSPGLEQRRRHSLAGGLARVELQNWAIARPSLARTRRAFARSRCGVRAGDISSDDNAKRPHEEFSKCIEEVAETLEKEVRL